MERMLEWAVGYAQGVLAERFSKRWEHSLGALRTAKRIAPILGENAELLAVAAVLHDVGYAPEAVDTGQHMIDGGRFLRAQGIDDRICAIVAHHTSSPWEAQELGLSDALVEFRVKQPELIDAITYCDLSSSPTGSPVKPEARISEVLDRYGEDHIVHRAVSAARPYLLEACDRIEERLRSLAPLG
jgi:putative nucleotidyltransferase with HDIG domain